MDYILPGLTASGVVTAVNMKEKMGRKEERKTERKSLKNHQIV